MKTNKKAVLGFAVAMILSLAFMQGKSMKSTKQGINVQQIGASAALLGARSEGEHAALYNYTAATLGSTAAGMTTVGLGSIYLSGTNPVGWGYWCVTGAVAL